MCIRDSLYFSYPAGHSVVTGIAARLAIVDQCASAARRIVRRCRMSLNGHGSAREYRGIRHRGRRQREIATLRKATIRENARRRVEGDRSSVAGKTPTDRVRCSDVGINHGSERVLTIAASIKSSPLR